MKIIRKIFLATFITFSSLGYAADASAAGGTDAISKAMCNITKLIQSDITKGVATIAVIFMAFGLFSGKVTWTVAIMTVIAIGAVMGADKIVSIMIDGSSGGSTCSTIAS